MQVFDTAELLAEYLGKQTCISQDRPGFIVNRILMPMINEAFYTLMEVTNCPKLLAICGYSLSLGPMT